MRCANSAGTFDGCGQYGRLAQLLPHLPGSNHLQQTLDLGAVRSRNPAQVRCGSVANGWVSSYRSTSPSWLMWSLLEETSSPSDTAPPRSTSGQDTNLNKLRPWLDRGRTHKIDPELVRRFVAHFFVSTN